jgi:DNA-binding LacI/PurR family transcriptional regulator
MPESIPVTMRLLGEKPLLSTMTVSRALRNAPGVSPARRQRALKAVRQSHYRPDPVLAVLNTYRHHRRRSISDAKIAFLTDFPTPDEWRSVATFARYFEGIRRRPHLLGYEVEPFGLGDPAPSSADVQVTRQLREAAKALNIELLDHVVVGNAGADPTGVGFYSFRSAGLL